MRMFELKQTKVKRLLIAAVQVSYWVLVAAIPATVWLGERTYTEIMTLYRPAEGHFIANDFEFYWHFLFLYSVVLVGPLCLWKIIFAIRKIGTEDTN